MFATKNYRSLRHALRRWFPRAAADEALFAFLVGTIHSAKAPLIASMTMAMAITLAAYQVTGAAIFLAPALAHVFIGFGRLERLAVHQAYERVGLTPREVAACDNGFAFWSTLYALTIGLTCFELTALAGSAETFALALSTCTGFSLAFVTRSAGRPRTLALQIAGATIPQVCALLILPVPHGRVYALLVVGLAGASLVMGRHGYERIVALFKADERNRRLAGVDMLTGLKNRFAITQAFARALAEALERPGGRLLVCVVDLDRFKEINDSLGHAAGDAVIVEAARRLSAVAGSGAEVARMGGDEFMLLARDDQPAAERPEAFGESILEALTRPFEIEGAAVHIGASVGLAVYPRHGRDMTELLRHADFALYDAKRQGRGRMRVFDDGLHRRLSEERALEIDLDEALREDQFELWYQPIQQLGSGSLRGYEALARWRHPTRGLVAPAIFVRLAEQNGSIFRLGEIVLQKACREAATWDRPLSVAVNLSPLQFRRPEPLVEAVKRALKDSGLEPSRLYLEITESSLMEDSAQTRRAINELADFGVKFSLDDFGAGYSSLAYIQNYPFSTIKIDRTFVANIQADRVSSAIVASVCVLAERIHMTVVAEGVETLVQSHALAELGVDLAQGYFYGRPAPIALPPPPQLKLVASG
jgi:diguanylate cyclase (GGDEF)-like protein